MLDGHGITRHINHCLGYVWISVLLYVQTTILRVQLQFIHCKLMFNRSIGPTTPSRICVVTISDVWTNFRCLSFDSIPCPYSGWFGTDLKCFEFEYENFNRYFENLNYIRNSKRKKMIDYQFRVRKLIIICKFNHLV